MSNTGKDVFYASFTWLPLENFKHWKKKISVGESRKDLMVFRPMLFLWWIWKFYGLQNVLLWVQNSCCCSLVPCKEQQQLNAARAQRLVSVGYFLCQRVWIRISGLLALVGFVKGGETWRKTSDKKCFFYNCLLWLGLGGVAAVNPKQHVQQILSWFIADQQGCPNGKKELFTPETSCKPR